MCRVIGRNEMATKMLKVLRKMVQHQLQLAFNTWREGADLSARQMRLMTACLNRMRNLAMSQAWGQWQFAYLERLRELEKLRRAAMKMMHAQKARAMNTWMSFGANQPRDKDMMNKAILRAVVLEGVESISVRPG